MSDKRVRARYAPSPTGFQHIGGVRTALFCYLFVKKHGGDFIVRIEDTDQTRFVEGAEEYIYETLDWCGITVDEGVKAGGEYGPYKQSERKGMYMQYAMQLVEAGHAYYAFDTSEELTQKREEAKTQGLPNWQYNSITRQYMRNSLSLSADEVAKLQADNTDFVIRLKVPRGEEVKLHDEIRGWVNVQSNQIDDKVLMKGDGMPTYHLANVVDDYSMKITHVIRGEEWLPSTPLHVLLYRYLGWEDAMPVFAHLPLILKPDGKGKLSKRDGDRLGFPVFPLAWEHPTDGTSSSGYKEFGFSPEAFINMLAFLGWNPGTEQEVFSIDELTEAFTLERVGKSGARFDWEKAKWYNQQYLKNKPASELMEPFKAILVEKNVTFDEAHLPAIVDMAKERATFLPDLWDSSKYFFTDDFEYDEKTIRKKWKPESKANFDIVLDRLKGLEDFTSENIETLVKDFLAEKELGFGAVLPPLRVALTGAGGGPPLFNIMEILGKPTVIERLEKGIGAFEAGLQQ